MAVPPWRETAAKMFPELTTQTSEAETPYQLWFDICSAFRKAYRPPRDESLIERVYEYAKWCEEAPRGETAEDDLFTCVVICFYEHVPDDKLTRADMPRWFTLKEVRANRAVFGYHIGDAGFGDLLNLLRKHQKMYRPWRAHKWDRPLEKRSSH